jgi:hypothetical protein
MTNLYASPQLEANKCVRMPQYANYNSAFKKKRFISVNVQAKEGVFSEAGA